MSKVLLATRRLMIETPANEWSSLVDEDTMLVTENESLSYREYINTHFSNLFKNVSFVDDYLYQDDKLEQTVLNLSKETQIEKIVCLAEVDIVRSAKLRSLLGINGQNTASAILFRNKFAMKSLAQQKGLSTPKFSLVVFKDDIEKFVEQATYPLILKPVDGRGSQNVLVIENKTDIESCLKNYNNQPILAEEFIDGDMYHIDGFFTGNELRFISVSQYVGKCLDFVHGKPLVSCTLENANPLRRKLVNFGTTLLKDVFPTPDDTLFHIEVFYRKNEIYLCEVACRLGGGMIFKEIETAYNINIKTEYLKSQCKTNYKARTFTEIVPKTVAARIMVPPRCATLITIPPSTSFSWVKEYQAIGKKGVSYRNPTMSNQEIAFFLLEAENEKEAHLRIHEILSWFNQEVQWKEI